MNRGAIELVAGPLRGLRRSMLGWGVGLSALVLVTVAFWPAFRGSSGISEAIDQLPAGVVEAFGLAGFGTPAGFLRGNLYEFIVPLLLAIAAVAVANGLSAADEDAGRLEIVLSQPVTRVGLALGRAAAMALWVSALTVVILVAQLAGDAAVGLSIDPGRVVVTIGLCGALAILAGAAALAIAGWWPRPAVVLALGVAAVITAYLVAALFQLSDPLQPFRGLSPWTWALGGDPLDGDTAWWRFAAPLVAAAVLVGVGTIGFARRDVHAP